jgi:putative oxygen-independent coproporphyrinogen III oxidase
MNNIPLSLYIHFPWCVRKCPYCDFNSHEANDFPESDYINTLLLDLEQELEQEPRRTIKSIFMGGGTPSLFSDDAIEKLLNGIRRWFDLSTIEITMEANPGTFDQKHFDGYRAAGVNRISLGAQSFSPASLERLGRIHHSEDIGHAFNGARQAGFERINIDLMHGLPNQTPQDACSDLQQAISLAPEHISWYQLTIEPNTVFYSRPPTLPVEDDLTAIFDAGVAHLQGAGYLQYETSAYALPGEQAHHNLNYWQFGDYLGIGAGAHGKQTHDTLKSDGLISRSLKTRMPTDYLANPTAKRQEVQAKEIQLEFLMNALRLNDGFEISLFEARTGLSRYALDDFISAALGKGLIETTDNHIKPSALGRRFLNDLLLLVD